MQSIPRFHASDRRPYLMLLVALLALGGVILARVTSGYEPEGTSGISAPITIELSSDAMIMRLQETLQRNPENTYAYAQLGLAFLQKVRETGDPALYSQAEMALAEALKRDRQQVDALIGQGLLALARHDFESALEWGEQARAVNPYRAEILGILVDALVELGRYDEAVSTAQAMVDLRPDLASYSRVSYLRELHGDTVGAIEAMAAAAKAGTPGAEATLWTRVQLGHLHFNSGDLEQAEKMYRQALYLGPDYVYATAGLARVQAARGQLEAAIDSYQRSINQLPLPEFVIALGELYEANGQMEEARAQYDLVQAIQQLNASAGVAVDLEMALFNADHGDEPSLALEQARAAYNQRPSIYGADVLAWALYKNAEFAEAQRTIEEAIRLGTRDAMLYYHAGMIYTALGDGARAKTMLAQALAINPYFDVLQAPIAHEKLAR
jgi:tetratricopeptide (TPR) repeat protein